MRVDPSRKRSTDTDAKVPAEVTRRVLSGELRYRVPRTLAQESFKNLAIIDLSRYH